MDEIEESQAEARLQALEAAVLQDIEQFGACSLVEKAKVQRLQQAVQEKLSAIRSLTRDLELLFEELDSDEDRQAVAALLTRRKAEYERIQQAFKAAALAQRRRAAASMVEERKELLAGAADPAARQRQLAAQGELVAASEGVTDGLRRTRQVLAEQLEHTSTTLAAMEQSHEALGKTKDEYQTQAGLLKTSKGLLGNLNWHQNAERWLLWIGLAVFMVVVAYIVQKRVGYFVPHALKPSTIIGTAAGYLRRAPSAPPTGSPLSPAAQQALQPPAPLPGDAPGLPPHFAHREVQQVQQPHVLPDGRLAEQPADFVAAPQPVAPPAAAQQHPPIAAAVPGSGAATHPHQHELPTQGTPGVQHPPAGAPVVEGGAPVHQQPPQHGKWQHTPHAQQVVHQQPPQHAQPAQHAEWQHAQQAKHQQPPQHGEWQHTQQVVHQQPPQDGEWQQAQPPHQEQPPQDGDWQHTQQAPQAVQQQQQPHQGEWQHTQQMQQPLQHAEWQHTQHPQQVVHQEQPVHGEWQHAQPPHQAQQAQHGQVQHTQPPQQVQPPQHAQQHQQEVADDVLAARMAAFAAKRAQQAAMARQAQAGQVPGGAEGGAAPPDVPAGVAQPHQEL